MNDSYSSGYDRNGWYDLYNTDHLEKDNPLIEQTLAFMYIPQQITESLRIRTGHYSVPSYVWHALIAESAQEHGAFASAGRSFPGTDGPLICFPLHDVKTKAGEQVYCILCPNGRRKQPWLLAEIYSAADVSVSAYGRYLFPEDLKKTRVPNDDRLSYSPFANQALLALLQESRSEPEPAPKPVPAETAAAEPAPESVPAETAAPEPGLAGTPAPEAVPAETAAAEPAPESVPAETAAPEPEPERAETPEPGPAGTPGTAPVPSETAERAPASGSAEAQGPVSRPPLPLCATHTYYAYQFYGTLTLENASGRDTLHYAILTVLDWLRARIGECVPEKLLLPPAAEYRSVTEQMLSSFHYSRGYSLDITSLPDEGRWALRVSEFDNGLSGKRVIEAGQAERPGVPGRSIITNVAFCLTPEKNTVEMAVLTEVEDPDSDRITPLPFTFRPAFIRTLLREPALTVSQVIPVRYKELLSLSGGEDFIRLRALMNDPLCSLPAVIFTHDKPDFTLAQLIRELDEKYGMGSALRDYLTGVDPDASMPLNLPFKPYETQKYADEMFGYARTYVLDSGLGKDLAAFLGRQMRPGEVLFWEPACFGGAIRSFRYDGKESMYQRDRIFKELKSLAYCYTTAKYGECLRGIPTGGVLFQPALREKEWEARVEQYRQEGAYELIGSDLDELEKRREELDRRESALSERESALERAKYAAGNRGAGAADGAFDFLRDPKAFPDTPTAVGRLIRALFPDRIDFTRRGWSTLEECTTRPDLLYEGLYHMANTLYELYSSSESKDIDKEFRDATGFEHGFSEGKATTEEQMKKRDDTYAGRTERFEAHIKKGNQDNKPTTLRVYYKYLPEERRIVISYCRGDHLENASSRKAK